MPDLEKFVETMCCLCEDDTHGYSQYNRYGPDYDCSSAVLFALKEAGWRTDGALTTDHIRNLLVPQGWAWLPPSVPKERGDILLSEDHHVAVYVGGGMLAEFAIDENGDIVGRLPGDQTGQEAYIHDYYNFPWDGVLRYTGDSSGEDKMHIIIQPFGENYLCYFNGEKIFYLSHPDQVEVLQMLFEQCNGKRMPSIILGAKDAPWFTRLREVFG